MDFIAAASTFDENYVKCQTCSDECPVFTSSGREEIYRPIFRGEVLRRIINKYINKENIIHQKLSGSDIDLNWESSASLATVSQFKSISEPDSF